MKIFSFWDSGRKNAPAIAAACLDRWETLNPEAELTVLSAVDIRRILDDFPFDVRNLPVQAQADILRIRLLRVHGGLWTDATVLPMLPLSDWADLYSGSTGFFVYSAAPEHWRLTNYLILAAPGNPFIAALDDRIRAYWTHPRRIVDQTPGRLQPRRRIGKRLVLEALRSRHMGSGFIRFYENWRRDLLYPVSQEGAKSRFFPYFWEQYLMMALTETNPTASAIVESMTYRQHDLSHSVQNARNTLGSDFEKAIPIALRTAPVQKLDWRVTWPDAVLDLPPQEKVLI